MHIIIPYLNEIEEQKCVNIWKQYSNDIITNKQRCMCNDLSRCYDIIILNRVNFNF